MANLTDQYKDFDPTQSTSSGCCGEKYYDYETQTWKVRTTSPSRDVDCSQIQAQLDEANATIADLNRLLEQKNTALANTERRVAELESQLAQQPSVCDILKQHLDPIYRLNGDLIGYGIKNPPECLTDGETVTGLNADNALTTVIPADAPGGN